ncbi:MAG: PRD domain-containing protein [Longicatena sp.]
MKIVKIFNNNIVATIAEDKTEMVVTGSGIGFHKHIGDMLEESRIEKTYVLDQSQQNKLFQLCQSVPSVYVMISEEIIDYASKQLKKKVSDQIMISLTDHIVFAVKRQKDGIQIPNLLLSEIKMLYRSEFEIGLWALNYIESQLKIRLPIDEAGYIAMHLVNATLDGKQTAVSEIIEFSKGIIALIETTFDISLDCNSLNYSRLMTHLKFLAQRKLVDISPTVFEFEQNEDMYVMLLYKYPQMQICVKKIRSFVKNSFDCNLNKEEILYIMIHITKIIH